MNGNRLLTVLLFANGLNAKHNACAFFPAKRHRCEAQRPRGLPRRYVPSARWKPLRGFSPGKGLFSGSAANVIMSQVVLVGEGHIKIGVNTDDLKALLFEKAFYGGGGVIPLPLNFVLADISAVLLSDEK